MGETSGNRVPWTALAVAAPTGLVLGCVAVVAALYLGYGADGSRHSAAAPNRLKEN